MTTRGSEVQLHDVDEDEEDGNVCSIGTFVIVEHESGSLTSDSLSLVVAASKFLSKDNSLSLLLVGSGPSLQDAATNLLRAHRPVSQASSCF
ncbi:hypothetical protein Tco_1555925 [Tanacetum coccineum]